MEKITEPDNNNVLRDIADQLEQLTDAIQAYNDLLSSVISVNEETGANYLKVKIVGTVDAVCF